MGLHYSMVDVLHTVIQTILYVRSSEVRNLYHARGGMYHHRVASKVIVACHCKGQDGITKYSKISTQSY
jgi:hypothetical protein